MTSIYEFEQTLDGLRKAYTRASAYAEAIPDPLARYRAADQLCLYAASITADAAAQRADAAATLRAARHLSLAALGNLIGVSKARAAQLVDRAAGDAHPVPPN